jgi:hypothetical protein
MKWAGLVARGGDDIYIYDILIGKSQRKTQLWTPRYRGKDSTEIDIEEGVGCIQVAQDTIQWQGFRNTAMNFRVPEKNTQHLVQLNTSRF